MASIDDKEGIPTRRTGKTAEYARQSSVSSTTGQIRNVPRYVRSHSDSFSEPLTLSEGKTSQTKPERDKTKPKLSKLVVSNNLLDSGEKSPWLSSKDIPEYYRSHSDSFIELCNVPDLDDNDNASSGSKSRKRCCKSICSNLEPKASWILLFFSIVPVNMMFGMSIIVFGLYYIEYVDYFGVSRSTVGIIVAIRTGVVSIFGILASTFIKRFSVRRISMAGGAIMVVANIINSFAPNVYVLYVSQGVLEGIGGSLLVMNSSVLIQQHFHKNRALGGGIGMLGYSLGHLIGPPFIDFIIQTYGWRGSMLISSAIYGNIIALSATFWHPDERTANNSQEKKDEESGVENNTSSQEVEETKPTKEVGVEDTDSGNDSDYNSEEEKPAKKTSSVKEFCKDVFNFRYFRDVRFTLVCISAAQARYNIKTFIEHDPSKCVSLGLTRSEAAYVISVFSVVAILMRTLSTFLANLKFVNRVFYYAFGVLVGSAASLMTLVHSLQGQALAAVLHGIHTGFTNTIQAVLIVDLMGIDKLAKSIALFNLMVGGWSMMAAPFGGYLYDVTENYDLPFIVSGALAFLAGIVMLGVGVPFEKERRQKKRQKQGEQEMEALNNTKTTLEQGNTNNKLIENR